MMNDFRHIRLTDPNNIVDHKYEDVIIEDEPEDASLVLDDDGNVIKIEHEDGSVTISLDGKPLNESEETEREKGWYDNLADEISDDDLDEISYHLLKGIESDIDSRREFIDDISEAIKLLGLKVRLNEQGASESSTVEGMSKIRHPMLLEAVLRFNANARSELLPTDGPVKIREDNNDANLESDALADDLEKDMNHYLTSTYKNYYPDTDNMLLKLGLIGTAIKKVYYCPIRNMPISESIDIEDFIVSDSAITNEDAPRLTHRIYMKKSVMKRMQILGVYRDIELGEPTITSNDELKQKKADQQGIKINNNRVEDRPREVYECHCELDIPGYEHKIKGKETGLEVPYRVTIDVTSKKILSIVRNYKESTKDMPVASKMFVKYSFVPGFGYYSIGLMHILGNSTSAVTAAWRELLDAGMFSNFPGFLISDSAGRQNTNIFRVPPGGGAMVKTGGQKIGDVVSPMPYQPPSATLMSLVDNIIQTGQRIGGTSEQMVGEGKQDAPVGTTLALIDQATKVLNAVHKRLHSAQSEEFELLLECFRQYPESFWQKNNRPARSWDQETFLRALDQVTLVPQSDPNTASQTQRIMKIMALKQIQAQNPSMYDPLAIDKAALKVIGWSNPEQFMIPISAMGSPPPQMQKEIALLKIKQQEADAKTKIADANALMAQSKINMLNQGSGPSHKDVHDAIMNEVEMTIKKQDSDARMLDAQTKSRDIEMEYKKELMKSQIDMEEMKNKQRSDMIDLAQNIAVHPGSQDEVAYVLNNVIPKIFNG